MYIKWHRFFLDVNRFNYHKKSSTLELFSVDRNFVFYFYVLLLKNKQKSSTLKLFQWIVSFFSVLQLQLKIPQKKSSTLKLFSVDCNSVGYSISSNYNTPNMSFNFTYSSTFPGTHFVISVRLFSSFENFAKNKKKIIHFSNEISQKVCL